VAFGFGAGLAPFAPGTFGTLLGWGLGWALGGLHAGLIFSFLIVCFLVGGWACEVTGRHLGVADHGAMVWDEVVAFLLVVAILPRELAWQAAGFVAFRFFDIVKPPPIRHLERRYGGGFGVMFDDLVAAAYTLLLLAAAKRMFF
jgi:phosphatidylglycerophosphatase A